MEDPKATIKQKLDAAKQMVAIRAVKPVLKVYPSRKKVDSKPSSILGTQ